MRIGYSYWGFLGDHKLDASGNEISSPDGNATYGWSIIWEMQRRGHLVYAMQEDRDYNAWKRMKGDAFAAFSTDKRLAAYENMRHTGGSQFSLPELDVLLVEWRFPIPGRNCGESDGTTYTYDPELHQPDYHRQTQMLLHYKSKNTKVILWDLDHKLTEHDERKWNPDAIFETSVTPLLLSKERTRVEIPFHIPDLLQHPTLNSDVRRKLVYIGSRYERDDVITEWIKPISDVYPDGVEFHGNWFKTIDECKKLWPNVSYNDRCTVKDFRRIYGTACACPLLAKRSYMKAGFITARQWETLLFGTLPVGLGSTYGIEKYVLDEMIVNDPDDLVRMMDWLPCDAAKRDKMRRQNVEKLEFMDAKHFVDKVEKVV